MLPEHSSARKNSKSKKGNSGGSSVCHVSLFIPSIPWSRSTRIMSYLASRTPIPLLVVYQKPSATPSDRCGQALPPLYPYLPAACPSRKTKNTVPLKVIKKRIEGGGAFTAGDWAGDLSRVLDDREQLPPRTSRRYVPHPATNPVDRPISIYLRTLTAPQTVTTHNTQNKSTSTPPA